MTGSSKMHATEIDRRSSVRRRSRGNKGRISPTVVTNVVEGLDLLLLLLGGILAKLASARLHRGPGDGTLFLATVVGSAVAASVFRRRGAYTLSALRSLSAQLELFPIPLLAGAGSIIICLFLMGQSGPDLRPWPWLWLIASVLLLVATHSVLTVFLGKRIRSGQLARRVAVIGANDFSREFIQRLRSEPHAFTVVGLYDDRVSRVPAVQDGVAIRGGVRDLLERSRQEQIDIIIIALPLSAADRISAIMEQLGSVVADVCLTTDFAGLRYSSGQISAVGSNPVVLIKEHPLKDWRAAKKRTFDLALGSLLLLIGWPLLAIVAIWVWLDSRGPALFRQPRLGFNNRPFICYKFRTMHHAMADPMGDRQASRGDPRVTRSGKLLRRFSLDELPQLFNVLKGDMSLVGPRPHAPNTKAADRLFCEVVAKYAIRHRVKPGITGWAQVNGWRGETTTVEQIENRVAYDLAYIERWSIWFDLRILLLTLTREVVSPNAF